MEGITNQGPLYDVLCVFAGIFQLQKLAWGRKSTFSVSASVVSLFYAGSVSPPTNPGLTGSARQQYGILDGKFSKLFLGNQIK